uniref:Uncharacterized protein n=1 Tax=Cucumis melo TaxID=3656 RepID=A0A9I9CBX9_CUCME
MLVAVTKRRLWPRRQSPLRAENNGSSLVEDLSMLTVTKGANNGSSLMGISR